MHDNTSHNKWRERLNSIPPPQGKEAWNSMEVLLDEHLPVKKRKPWFYVGNLILLLLVVFPICNRPGFNDKLVVAMDAISKQEPLPKQNNQEERKGVTNKTKNKIIATIKEKPIIGTNRNKEHTTNKTKNNTIVRNKENSIYGTNRNIELETNNNTIVRKYANRINRNTHKRKNNIDSKLIRVSTNRNETVKINNSSSINSNKRLSPIEETNKQIFIDTETRKVLSDPPNEPLLKPLPSLAPDTVIKAVTDSTKNTLSNPILKGDTASIESLNDTNKKEQLKPNRKWAFSAGFNYFFPVNDQRRASNIDWKEFLPVVQTQFYLNDKIYLQSGLQWYAPQYTNERLVYRRGSVLPLTPGSTTPRRFQESIFVKKLFYMDIPLSIHISPIKNTFIGGGIQYSGLRKAIGQQEHKIISRGRPDSFLLVNTLVIDPYLTNEIFKKHETRFLFDVATKIKRFNVGVQYNQAFKSYIKNRIPSSLGSLPKNKSLHIFLRYQLKGAR